ncbi:hypothetical protein VNO77_37890 [Canavalia gladiata]|uniref:gibberellin 2beta-dioxygenase n=1 Tax=Canavalia gladiata TaxID=3824 RepID=A0AAN9PUZ2_CANGL
MVVLSKPTSTSTSVQYSYSYIRNCKTTTFPIIIPVVDLSKPDAKTLIVNACDEFGFFKVINHGVPMDSISNLESEAVNFFSLPFHQKQQAGPPNPSGYGNKKIGVNGDVGWVEYLHLTNDQNYNSMRLSLAFGHNPHKFCCALSEYMCTVRKMGCEILDLMAEGLNTEQKNVLSKLVMDKESDSVFRLNHYPPCPPEMGLNNNGEDMVGFGEHTDPQIISLLRSNNTSGLQICLKDNKSWISVPPDHNSFFVNVGDCLQVMTNGRFKSVKHRVLANGLKSRLSMIYFCGPPLGKKITPLHSLMKGKQSLYKEFTWFEYKKSAYATRLADNRLRHFERIAAS